MSYRTIVGSLALGILAMLVIFGYGEEILLIPSAYAQAGGAAQGFNSIISNVVLFLITILNFISWFMLSLLDMLMDPVLIFDLGADGQDTGLLNMLREIWQFTRDIVNLGFAIGLIVGAVMMLITADGSKVKEYMPKFILALVLVNFSWFIPRVIFDVSQVATYTVYQIPSLVGANDCTLPPAADDPTGERRPCEVVLNYKFLPAQTETIGDDGVDSEDGSTGWSCPLKPLVCIQTRPMSDPNDPNYTLEGQVRTETRILDGLVVNHARLQWLAQVNIADEIPEGIGASDAFFRLMGVIARLVMTLVIHVAVVFPLIALTAAFFLRIPVLWVTIAFMPLVALGYVFSGMKEMTDQIFKQFIQAVFLPVKVAVPFVIGFIMLNAGSKIGPPDSLGRIPLLPLFVGVSDLWQLLWMGIAIFILWKYAFEALKPDKAGVLGFFTEKIHSMGKNLGSVVAQWPLTWQFIPVPGAVDQNGMQARVSPLQALKGLSLARMRSELSTMGRVSTFRERLGLAEESQSAVAAIRRNPNIRNQLTVNLQTGTREGVEEALKTFRERFGPQFQRVHTNEDIINAIIQASGLNAKQAAELRERVRPFLSQVAQPGAPAAGTGAATTPQPPANPAPGITPPPAGPPGA